MTDKLKPPLGCAPADIVAEERLYNLVEAFKRNIGYKGSIPIMRLWLKEMKMQLDIIEECKGDFPF